MKSVAIIYLQSTKIHSRCISTVLEIAVIVGFYSNLQFEQRIHFQPKKEEAV